MLSFILSAIKIIFLLGFLIFIHEGGHFLVAKLCKVKVNQKEKPNTLCVRFL